MSDIVMPILQHLVRQSPMLLIYVIAIVLAVVFLRRYPSVSVLVGLGGGLLLFSSVGYAVAFQIIVHSHNAGGWPGDRLHTVFLAMGLVNSLFRAVGMAFFLAAAFVGRGRQDGGEMTKV